MGFDRRFTAGLIGWVAGLFAAVLLFTLAALTPDLAAARLVAGLLVAGAAAGLWQHVNRTNRMLAQFVTALRFGDFALRFDDRTQDGFGELGVALNVLLHDLRERRDATELQLRFLEALVDDVPVALLTVDPSDGVRLVNKTARRLFAAAPGPRAEDFAMFGESFAARLGGAAMRPAELLILRFAGGLQRSIVRAARLERLGKPITIVSIQPVQTTLDTIEMAAQTDLVRVLTHEILNSLTPVTSLAGLAADAVAAEPPDLDSARLAMRTLVRRAEGLGRFIDSYRAVARPPDVRLQVFLAEPLAQELARLTGAEFADVALVVTVVPGLELRADPDLLAQALINLLRNAAQAAQGGADAPSIRFILEPGQIRVIDNGAGVPVDLRRDVFLPFFTTKVDGTGIGLNLVRQIVTAHGWSIELLDAEGGGAEFRIAVRDA